LLVIQFCYSYLLQGPFSTLIPTFITAFGFVVPLPLFLCGVSNGAAQSPFLLIIHTCRSPRVIFSARSAWSFFAFPVIQFVILFIAFCTLYWFMMEFVI
ncbi:MAG: hypothetical protein ACRC9V_09215, partial [Aeromonas sp.]